MKAENEMTLTFPSRSANEAFARAAVACFAAQLDPNLEELNDIKTAVSEAVTNCIVHAYRDTIGLVTIRCRILPEETDRVKSIVMDYVNKNRVPVYDEQTHKGLLRHILALQTGLRYSTVPLTFPHSSFSG